MLNRVFLSDPIKYLLPGAELLPCFPKHLHGLYWLVYNDTLSISGETLAGGIHSLWVLPTPYDKKGSVNLYVQANVYRHYYPGSGGATWRWNGDGTRWADGICSGRISGYTNFWGGSISRNGKLWSPDYFRSQIEVFEFTAYALIGEIEAVKPCESWHTPATTFTGQVILGSHFEGNPGGVGSLSGLFVVDEVVDRFVFIVGLTMYVYTLSTGAFLYEFRLPDNVAAVCLEDDTRLYVLFRNRVLILFDYIRGEMMGAVKVPSYPGSHHFAGTIYSVRIAWDGLLRRLYIAEATPDNEDGTSSVRIAGYRMVPVPVHLTQPIPLRVPKQGRIIPVLTSVLGDMSEGVGGHIISAVVVGAGSLAGVPITDNVGNSLIPVACEGNPVFVGPEDSLEVGNPGGTPPDAGTVSVVVSVSLPPMIPVTP